MTTDESTHVRFHSWYAPGRELTLDELVDLECAAAHLTRSQTEAVRRGARSAYRRIVTPAVMVELGLIPTVRGAEPPSPPRPLTVLQGGLST